MTHSLSPSAILPALATLHDCSAARVEEALRALRDVYFPHTSLFTLMSVVPVLKESLSDAIPVSRPKQIVRISHRDDSEVPDSGYASAEEDDQDEETREIEITNAADEEDKSLDILRLDDLERGYAVKWLTGLVKRGDAWIYGTSSSEEEDARAMHLEDASRLLALFAGDDAPEEAMTRTFTFPLRVPPCYSNGCRDVTLSASPITVELNDAPVDGTDHTAVGLQSWGSAIIFAERMCLDPERFLGPLHRCPFIPAAVDDAGAKIRTSTRSRRALELGAGTGLLSITAAQIFFRFSVQADIKATDYHPSVLENLARNVQQNPSARCISVEKLDWCAMTPNEDGVCGDVYDVVLAADVVYHPDHASWIRGCVEWTLSKDGVFWLIIPKRTIGRHEGLEETVEATFPVVGDGGLVAERLSIVRREEVHRVDGVGRVDEGGYTLFEIRWVY